MGLASHSIPPTALESEQKTEDYVECADGSVTVRREGRPAVTFLVKDGEEFHRLMRSDAYSCAIAFITSQFDVRGNLVEAVRLFQEQPHNRISELKSSLLASAARLIRPFLHGRSGSTGDGIKFHYDKSNDFYHLFLDSRMVYSCGYFKEPDLSLDDAQVAKLDHICRKLQMEPGDRFLDVGCGWGALVMHAAQQYNAYAAGCTLSESQLSYATAEAGRQGLASKTTFSKQDFRSLTGEYDKIASVGMFEHVGHKSLAEYFSTIFHLLTRDGLFLNHGIVRAEGEKDGPETLFLQRYVFPGGKLVKLSEVIRSAESAGLEIFDIENLRPHYARTCRVWVERLRANKAKALECTDLKSYRTWLLYLAASSLSFETAQQMSTRC